MGRLCILPPYDETKIRFITKWYDKCSGRFRVFIYPKSEKKYSKNYSRYLMEKYLGKFLENWIDVHHKDKNKLNDKISNLECIHVTLHHQLHTSKYQLDYQTICLLCGTFFKLSRAQRAGVALKRNKNQGRFCSLSCASKSKFSQYANNIKENTEKRNSYEISNQIGKN